MTTVKYNIVEFTDHSMSVIPRIWLNHDEKTSYWPLYKGQLKVNKAIINMEQPDDDK